MDWILDVNFIGNKVHFFNIPLFYAKYSLCTFCELFIWSLKHFRKKEYEVKKKNEISVCIDLKTDLHSCYELNCVHP